jgi:hypothetical protein
VAERTVKRLLCCGFRRTDEAMGCREINVFSKFKYHVSRLISICHVFADSCNGRGVVQ